MSKQQPGQAHPATALSPYLSLRESVRPAIAAYTLLAGERERSGALVKECESLLATTRDLLKTAALVHLLSPEPGAGISSDASGSRRAQLLDAYADAGMLWARIVGSCTALAGVLAEQERWDDIESLAAFLQSAGETKAAADFRKRSRDAAITRARQAVSGFRDDMPINEIRAAMETLAQIARFKDNNALAVIADGLMPIVRSMYKFRQPNSYGHSTPHYAGVLQAGCVPEHAVYRLRGIDAEFRLFYP